MYDLLISWAYDEYDKKTLKKNFIQLLNKIKKQVSCVIDDKDYVEETILELNSNMDNIIALIKKDALAGVIGDPACKSIQEVYLSYPYLRALVVHRIAHFLFKKDIPLIPRLLSEVVHSQTGIDIHPGATIGESFFIDHGTGVVIGETAVIGNNVKIYQGVTLGAYSFPKDACGALIKGEKRHPRIEDNVIIYANATVLGNIVIGKNAIIGSNVRINRDVKENTMLILKDPEILERTIKEK